MTDFNQKYLEENFLSLEDLAEQSGISMEKLGAYIEKKMIPRASYKVRQNHEISSALGDSYILESETSYFPKSYVDLAQGLENRSTEETKKEFIDKMKNYLLDHQAKEIAYKNAVSDSGKLDAALEEEWNHYLNGIYGICTLNATPEEIIEKEVAVKKLQNFLADNEVEDLLAKKSELEQIISEYDLVSSRFAPYQRESSSRGKYVDKSLQNLGLEDKIKSY